MSLISILQSYNEAKEKGLLNYLLKPTRGAVRNCLISYLNSEYYDRKQNLTILAYFKNENFNTIETVITESENDEKYFKAISELLMHQAGKPNRLGTLGLLRILLDYDIEFGKSIKNKVDTRSPKSLNSDEVIQRIKEVYKTNILFNSIRINGDTENKVGSLSMDDYYIQLSYTSYQDLHNRESLLRLEKEYSFSKVDRIRDVYYDGDLSQGYISESILANKRVIISGNPGVGKSTYARWICYQWAHKHVADANKKPLIYIQLRDLNFEQKDFLLHYINNFYFKNSKRNVESMSDLINFQLLLDGYDEISSDNRTNLLLQIGEMSFIVLSRPYGLLNHKLIYDFSVQIDGFNSNCIENYIYKLVHEPKKIKQLQDLIEQNKVLKDYASTPLMLSYIVLIFTVSDDNDVKKELSSIESVYDLQEKVFDWILKENIKKGNIHEDSLSQVQSDVNEFAYLMLINKKFSYTGTSTDKKNYLATAKFLAAAGLGNCQMIKEHSLDWKFSFNTITFQEFLCAQYLESKKLNHEAIVYLVEDSFFWNLCIMIVGMLSKEEQFSENTSDRKQELIQLLEYIYEKYAQEDASIFYGYAYYMLLAECNREVVRVIVKEEDINRLIKFNKNIYFDNIWNDVILESVEKIMYKLPHHFHNTYAKVLTTELRKLNIELQKEYFNFENYFHLTDLLKIGIQYENEDLAHNLIEVLILIKNKVTEYFYKSKTLLEEYGEYDIFDNQEASTEYENNSNHETWARELLSTLFFPINSVSEKIIIQYKAELLDMYRLEHNNIDILNSVIEKLIAKHSISDILLMCQDLKKEDEENSKENTIFFINLFKITEFLFGATVQKNTYTSIEERQISIVVNFIIHYILNNEIQDQEPYYSENYFAEMFIEVLINLDDKKLFQSLDKILIKSNADVYSRIPNEKAYIDYINYKFDSVIKEFEPNAIYELLFLMGRVPNTQFCFYIFKDNLSILFKKLIDQSTELPRNNKELETTLFQFTYLSKESYEKKIFIDHFFLIEKKLILDNEILQNTLIVLTSNFIFYEEKYWDLLLLVFKKQNWDTGLIVRFFSNEKLSLFKSNYSKIIYIFIETFKKNINFSSLTLSLEFYEILTIITRILYLVKNYEGYNKKEVFPIIEKILTAPPIHEYCETSVDELEDFDTPLAIILFNYYSPIKEDFLKNIDFQKQFRRYEDAKIHVFETLIKFAENKEYGINMNDIEVFEPILGEQLYAELLQLIQQRLILKEKFDRKHFEALLETKN